MILTEALVNEHKLIKRMIDVLEKNITKLDEAQAVEPFIFEQATDFIRNFADKFHHAKEEEILFKEMAKKGMPEKDSPIEVMLIEHEQGRAFVMGLIEATEQFKKGNKKAVFDIIRNARGYIELLKEHIDKEDNILYPLAEKIFTEEEKEKQQKKFEKAELKKGGEATIKRYENIVIKLELNKARGKLKLKK